MPKNFTTNKRYLTDEEKLIEYFEEYKFDNPDFEYEYIFDPNYRELTLEEIEFEDKLHDQLFEAILNDDYDLEEKIRKQFIDIPERKIDVEKTFDLLPDEAKKEALLYIQNDLFEETITLKCLKCDYEETVDYDIVEECWMDGPYPVSYCPHCDKGDFVPLDIYNKKKRK